MAIENKPVVLVTGGSGYIGSHIVDHLLKEGYRVRTTIRPGRSSVITKTWPTAVEQGQLTPVEIADLSTGDFTAALEGVSVLLHVAATTFGKGQTGAQILDASLAGTTNVIGYALKAGVKKIVVTGSYSALFSPDFAAAFGTQLVTEDSWGSITKQEQINLETESPMAVYAASKALAELKVWELADANPDVDFTTILPSAVFGSFLPTYPAPTERSGLGMANQIYGLIAGGSAGPNTYPDTFISDAVHVSDVARAHVLAIAAPPLSGGRRKRCVVASQDRLLWPVAAEYLRETRPELRDRLPSADAVAPKQTSAPLSTKVAEEVLGLKPKDYIGWKRMVDEGIEAGLGLERK